MNKGTYLIDEDEDLFLKNFSYFCEISDITKTKDSGFLFTLEHGIHVALLNNVGTDDLSTRTTEDSREQGTNLDDSIADDCRFKFDVCIKVLLCG